MRFTDQLVKGRPARRAVLLAAFLIAFAQTPAGAAPAGAQSQAPPPAQQAQSRPFAPPAPVSHAKERLHGHVVATPSPLLSGSVQTMPEGTKVDLVLTANLNSEVSQKGDEVVARVAMDVKNGEKVLLPGGWYVRGIVSDIASRKRLGRDGFVEIEFDTLVSPDGNYELPFPAKLSTRDNTLKAVAKTLAIDTGYVAEGALGGAILSVQLTGVPMAISTQGYSVAGGAAIGGAIGLFGALKRKGNISSFYPGDELKLTLAEPLSLPGFDPKMLPSARPKKNITGLALTIDRAHFGRDPLGDTKARILSLDATVSNHTGKDVALFDFAVVSDHEQRYHPSPLAGDFKVFRRRVADNATEKISLTFSVDSPKRKYWLVYLDKGNREELSRVPIN